MTEPVRFIGVDIEVEFDREPLFRRSPHCPARLVWAEETLPVVDLLKEWRDYGRRGRMASNMRPENLARAAKRGSFGVGRYYFRVRVADGRCFELYYDRKPQSIDDKTGRWVLLKEVAP